MKPEIRVLSSAAEVRSTGGRGVTGYALLFGVKSELMQNFREIIRPEAIEGVLPKSDVLALLNHDLGRGVLARSDHGKGTLSLSREPKGLKYSFESPQTALGDELLEGLRRGDIKSSSFAFTVAPGGDSWSKQDDGSYIRTITQINELYDVSPCYKPAYSDTTAALRSLEDYTSKHMDEGQLRAEYDALLKGMPKARPVTKYVVNTPAAPKTPERDIYMDIVTRGQMTAQPAPKKVKGKSKKVHRFTPEEQKLIDATNRLSKGNNG